MAVTVDDIKALRESTGAGIMECKEALEQSEGDQNKATDILRTKGFAQAAKRSDKGNKANKNTDEEISALRQTRQWVLETRNVRNVLGKDNINHQSDLLHFKYDFQMQEGHGNMYLNRYVVIYSLLNICGNVLKSFLGVGILARNPAELLRSELFPICLSNLLAH